ncbi:uncharacterized protein BDZ99DRAFT_485956 [Mytilinidion resinicola]|uniref:Uncharacterized protein n=1 Tax=Mytilinidion resinicola TaxID=574789 RepID=A0A6A6YYM1_9PEZI|nr:uncharacterized protein BDZ99DRAFT_485956 [Mytilinidion resinicola]KAF2813860.1 hypothetical protein BDZ99DRAFT_485956 [Mytilinidion resinicola]
METRRAWILVLLAFFALTLISSVSAASPTSFCKCTCNGNSTIVALDSPATKKPVDPGLLKERASRRTCSDCNRQFCLGYPFCQGAPEEEVFTTCFQRDSTKDQAVVFIFILATVGLLTYAAVRPWIDQWAEKARERRNYIPVGNTDN